MVLFAALAWPGEARQQPPQNQPTFRSGVDVVQVDVSVLDRNRRPVTGLTQGDFTILENGKPQEIVAFAPIDVPGPEEPTARWIRDIGPDVRSNSLGDGRLFAIILDDATMPFDLRAAASAKQIARGVVERLGTADLAAVIYTQNNRRSVDFTQDRGRLLTAIEAFKPGFTYGDPTTDRIHFQASIRTLAQTSAYLATVPQRRKAIVYVSTGVPLDLQVFAKVTLLTPKEGEVLDVDLNTDLYNSMSELLVQRPQEAFGLTLQEALIRAQDGNVNVYSMDPAGAGGLGAYFQNRTTIEQLDAQTRAGRGVVVRPNPLEPTDQARLHRDFLEIVAENSGGRAFVNSNDFDAGLRQIFRENSSYYLVGYRSTLDRTDRRTRRVTVRMQKPGLTARTRNAYYAPRGRTGAMTPAEFRLTEALHGILPSPEIMLRASAAVFSLPARAESGVAIAIGVQHPPLPGDIGARASGSLELLTTAHGPDGQVRGSMKQSLTLKGRSGADQLAEYEVLSRLDLPPGGYQLRIAARIPALDRTGSVYYDVVVPDFRRDPVALSGIVLTAAPSLITAGADVLSTVLPVVPTSRRAFTPDFGVNAYVEVYHGTRAPAAAVPLTVTITDDADRRVVNVADLLTPDRFNDRFSAPYQFTVPIDRLRAGKYLLTIEAAEGNKRARRDVRFEVR